MTLGVSTTNYTTIKNGTLLPVSSLIACCKIHVSLLGSLWALNCDMGSSHCHLILW